MNTILYPTGGDFVGCYDDKKADGSHNAFDKPIARIAEALDRRREVKAVIDFEDARDLLQDHDWEHAQHNEVDVLVPKSASCVTVRASFAACLTPVGARRAGGVQ